MVSAPQNVKQLCKIRNTRKTCMRRTHFTTHQFSRSVIKLHSTFLLHIMITIFTDRRHHYMHSVYHHSLTVDSNPLLSIVEIGFLHKFSKCIKDMCYAWSKYSTSGYFGQKLCYYTIFLKSDEHFFEQLLLFEKIIWITGQNVQKLQILLFFCLIHSMYP